MKTETLGRRWVLDGSHDGQGFCFTAVEGDLDGEFTLIDMFFIGPRPPHGEVVGAIHPDGDGAAAALAERWRATQAGDEDE